MRFLSALVMLGTAVLAYPQTAPFTIALSAAKSQVTAGDPVDLVVVMTNTSDHDVDCTYNYGNALDRNYVYEVTDEKGAARSHDRKEVSWGV